MTRKRLMQEMGANEIWEWIAYEMSLDPKIRDKAIAEIENEKMLAMTDEERAQMIKTQFMLMGQSKNG